jgi:crossover junction endodeoxyribonuclease RuvC
MSYLIGIDPGISGAIAVLSADGSKIIAVHDMPTYSEIVKGKPKQVVCPVGIATVLRKWGECEVVIEKVGAMAKGGVSQGAVSMFSFGKGAGAIEGACAGLLLKFRHVTPKQWQAKSGKASGKDASRALAAQLYPDSADLFKLVKHDGRAEAVLIARFGICLN